MTNPNGSTYRLRVTLRETQPPIWRRLEVPADLNLSQLHRVLQVAMGWTDSHLHQFEFDETIYGVPHPELEMPVENEARVRLDSVLHFVGETLVYEYDFGDSWEHEIVLEAITEGTEPGGPPVCLAGGRHCPPEDCGGISGFYDFLEAMADPEHPEHEETAGWCGGSFDPEAFDLGAVNGRLRKMKPRRRGRVT